MLGKKKVLALIPARGGSKGIPKKNSKLLCNKPLIAYTIEAATESKFIDDVVVTTDSKEIAHIAKKYGAMVPFMRPSLLADDKSKTIDSVLHALEELKKQEKFYDVLVLLQPTSPLRTSEDIKQALQLFDKNNNASVVAVTKCKENPILVRKMNENGKLSPILKENSTIRRQDMEEYFHVNGSIYIYLVENISEETSFNDGEVAYVMEAEHSVDIDENVDFAVAEYYLGC